MGLFLIERYERSIKDILPQNFFQFMGKLFQKERPTMEIKILRWAFALSMSVVLVLVATCFAFWTLAYAYEVSEALWLV
nr:MAG TPA: hypothetical protein [Caudoviricetes sp.]